MNIQRRQGSESKGFELKESESTSGTQSTLEGEWEGVAPTGAPSFAAVGDGVALGVGLLVPLPFGVGVAAGSGVGSATGRSESLLIRPGVGVA